LRTEQAQWTSGRGWTGPLGGVRDAQLVLVFGSGDALEDGKVIEEIGLQYPHAELLGCSTAGEIMGTRVTDGSLSLTAIRFERTTLKAVDIQRDDFADSGRAGAALAERLDPEGLVHTLVISDGQHVNGSELVKGIASRLPPGVTLTGGLAGDGSRFQRTVVLRGRGVAREKRIALLGLYGPSLKVGFGSLGGWDSFGPVRQITRSRGNVLYELDGEPALHLYKRYLGAHADGLPSTGLLFPLSVKLPDTDREVVRTILAVDEAEQSVTFAGDLPQGASARLMKANFDRLVDGAQGAARTSHDALGSGSADLALLISCVGRKLVLKGRTEEELEAVREVLGPQATLTGFYSYGEICPAAPNAACDLHNQTMTITTFRET
jgi:hypothetical protein